MTIIVNYFGFPVVIQVSDRQLTYANNQIADKDTTKSIVWEDRWLIGFTGPAFLGTMPTHLWLAERLHKHSQVHSTYRPILDKVAVDLAVEVQKLPVQERKLALSGVGWAIPEPHEILHPGGPNAPATPYRPYAWSLSNFTNADGDDTGLRSSFTFLSAHDQVRSNTSIGIHTVGAPATGLRTAFRQLKRARSKSLIAEAVARTLVDMVQRMQHPTVGKAVLASCLPVPGLGNGSIRNGPIDMGSAAFYLSDPDGTWHEQRGPVIVDRTKIIDIDYISYGGDSGFRKPKYPHLFPPQGGASSISGSADANDKSGKLPGK